MRPTAIWDSAKDLKDWAAIIVLFCGCVFQAVTSMYGKSWGEFAHVFSNTVCLLGVFLLFAYRILFKDDVKFAEIIAEPQPNTPLQPLTEDQRKYLNLHWKRRSVILRGVFALMTTFAVILGYYQMFIPWHQLWLTSRPDTLTFNSATDNDSIDDREWQTSAPFVEAVYNRLETTGALVADADPNKKFRILKYKAPIFTHPSPAFETAYKYDSDLYTLAGYALLRHPTEHGDSYSPILVENGMSDPQGARALNLLILKVPEAEKGDQVVLLLRLTLNKGGDFPDDFLHILTPSPIPSPKRPKL